MNEQQTPVTNPNQTPVTTPTQPSLEVALTHSTEMYCSIIPKTDYEKAQIANMTIGSDIEKIGEYINTVVSVKDIFVEMVDIADEDTGEILRLPRVVLITDIGRCYQATSRGIFSSLTKLFMIYGTPTWETPVPVKFKQITTKRGHKMLTLEVTTK